ncbi:N-acetylmuramoyl-L-alanine amidase [Priestia megaterium]|uniref:N-acetylmuramoyl-L-alanine amidase n=1 Tax=Priestia megaterium TaxID=1404 RepID=UPI000BF990CC|nr:N-acetylmuramoyl-L-alanine amidase [Priestia megaterium]PEZ06123.1 N-acetylmuramoyl-L-alanine amidase [Priestia megaterium]
MLKVVLDPGHGGHDPGAVSKIYNLKEKDINLKIALYIKEFLEIYKEVKIKMTRINDVFVSLENRVKIANKFKADIFLSIHVNSSEGGTGFESFIYLETENKTLELQKVLHEEIMNVLNNNFKIKDRGTKKADFFVLRKTNMPAILTENLFIEVDNELLKNEAFLKQLGQAHANGIIKFFEVERK